jgi:hypothetical protein
MSADVDGRKEHMEAAAKSVAAKLRNFQGGLTAGEHLMLSLAISAVAAAQRDEDVAGFADTDPIGTVRDWCLTWRYPWGTPRWPLPEPTRLA